MANIILRDNPVSGSVPLAANMMIAELVVNTADGRLFTKNGSGDVVLLNNKNHMISASHAVTASYALSSAGGSSVSASYALTSSYAAAAQTLIGSVVSSSYAVTASYALNGGGGGSPFPFTGNAIISGNLTVSGTVTALAFDSLSDRAHKNHITRIDDAMVIIDQLNGVRFMWKASQQPSAGLIAQDVEAVLPELVTTNDAGKVLNYNGVIGVLVEAVKSLSKRVDELERDQL